MDQSILKKLNIGDFVIIRNTSKLITPNSVDVIGKVIVIREKIIVNLDVIITLKYPKEFRGLNYPLYYIDIQKEDFIIVGKSPLFLALYD